MAMSRRSSNASICILVLVAAAFVSTHAAIEEKLFNVLDFGAKPGDIIDNSEAFTRAWVDACNHPGKATLIVPTGDFMLSAATFAGPCQGAAPIAVEISGTLKASTNLSLYPKESWLLFQDISGLVISGDGTVDGQGNGTWHTDKCDDTGGKCSILPALEDLHILAPEESPNTDGIHISKSVQVSVARSIIQTGDDCIGMIQGNTNISISEVTCGPGHGISVGSMRKYENEKDVVGITVVNCTLKATENGIRIKTYPNNGKAATKATGFLFKVIFMDRVKNPIIITQDYCGSGSHCFGDKPSNIEISDVEFSNITGTSQTEPAVTLSCSSEVPCRNVTFDNINLVGVDGAPSTATCIHASVNLQGLQIPPIYC